ncbi:MAG: hypothetical protein QME77_07120 [bacterium]|nr:hypothetical protein [bacterium]
MAGIKIVAREAVVEAEVTLYLPEPLLRTLDEYARYLGGASDRVYVVGQVLTAFLAQEKTFQQWRDGQAGGTDERARKDVMTRNGAPVDAGSTPFLRECVEMIVARGAEFEGHPEYREGSPSIGRWRHVTRDGDDLLLVTRDVLDAFILGLGGNSGSVLGLWRSLGILRSSAENRLVYRVGPTLAYVALRRSALFKAGFQDPSSSPTTPVSDATATG